MAYDRESIDGARKAGVLDSELDAMALGLEDDEKAALNERIKSAQPEEEVSEPAPAELPRRRKAGREPAQPLTLWQKIVNFFRTLFAGLTGPGNSSRKAVREVENSLAAFTVPVFDPRMRAVRKDFIEYIKQIEQKVQVFKDFFNANFNVSNEDLIFDRKPSFARFVIENMLTMEQLSRLREMRGIDLSRSFSVRGEEETQRDMDVQIRQFEDSFNRDVTSRIESHLELFVSIINLMNYNFHGLFVLFLKEGADQDHPVFRDFPLEHAVVQFRNFDSYLAGIPFRTIQEEHYQWFERFAQYKQERQFEEEDFSLQDFKDMLQPLRKLADKRIITGLVQVGLEDPKYRPKPVVNTISYVKKFKSMFAQAIRDYIQRNIMILREKQVEQLIDDLFEGGKAYAPLAAATRTFNENIQSAGVQGFEHAFVFSLVVRYLEVIYNERFRKSVNAIVVEGDFRKKEMAQEFSNTYYGLDELFERAKQLWSEVDENSTLLVGIDKLIAGNLENPIARRKLENDIRVADEALKDLGHTIGRTLIRLYRLMEPILRDFKGLRVVDLVNAKTIGGVANRSLVYNYDKLVVSLKKLEEILARFIVTAETLEQGK